MLSRRDFGRGAATSLGAMAVLSSGAAGATPEPKVSLNILYPNREGARFDLAYYRSVHIPLAMKVMGAADVMLIEGVPMGNVAPPYVMIAHFQFASSAALEKGLANPAIADVRADIARFTDIKPTVMRGSSA